MKSILLDIATAVVILSNLACTWFTFRALWRLICAMAAKYENVTDASAGESLSVQSKERANVLRFEIARTLRTLLVCSVFVASAIAILVRLPEWISP